MLVSKNQFWNPSHNEISKYFIERLMQLSDYNEIISNRHKTTNGYILLAEINEVTRLVLNRQKSIHRFKSLITESIDDNLSSSIVNDPILKKYHKDIIEYYKKIEMSNVEKNEKLIKLLQTRTRVFLKKLDLEYYDNIKKEIGKIEFTSDEHFRTKRKQIDSLLEVLLPFLIFKGYSVETISKMAMYMTRNSSSLTLVKIFFDTFNLAEREYEFLLNESKDELTNEYLLRYLNERKISFEIVASSTIKDSLTQTNPLTNNLIKFKISTIDANNFIRDTYDTFIKDFIIAKERTSLEYFLDFFDKTHWKLIGKKPSNYKKSGFKHDPINVASRESTLRNTLEKVSDFYKLDFNNDSSLDKIPDIAESIYFYNLALGSKSIENSLNLLWTSLETLIPYGKYESDIANIQYFFPKFLSTGAVGRQLVSFILRFHTSNAENSYMLNSVKPHFSDYSKTLNIDSICKWLDFAIKPVKGSDDPYKVIKNCSELLCTQYCYLNEAWGSENIGTSIEYAKLSVWKTRIDSSRLSIQYQLDRIYLHRNQIIHTAKFINEYSNLWAHLEWYVGKILSYFYIRASQSDRPIKKKEILIELEGECEMIYNMIERDHNRNIIDLSIEEKRKIFMQVWQFI